MTSEPLSKVLALLACLSILVAPAYGDTRNQTLAEIEEERLRALLAEIDKARVKPIVYAEK